MNGVSVIIQVEDILLKQAVQVHATVTMSSMMNLRRLLRSQQHVSKKAVICTALALMTVTHQKGPQCGPTHHHAQFALHTSAHVSAMVHVMHHWLLTRTARRARFQAAANTTNGLRYGLASARSGFSALCVAVTVCPAGCGESMDGIPTF